MALIKCWECGVEVSSSVPSCPRCGAAAKPQEPPAPSNEAGMPAPHTFEAAVRPAMSKVRRVVNIIGIVWLVACAVAIVWFFVLPHGVVLHDGSVSVGKGKYWSTRFALRWDANVTISARVASGPAVDIYLMDPVEVGRFTSGKQFKFIPALSQGTTRSFTKTAHLSEGDYVIVVDNSDSGDAKPPMNMKDAAATVEIRINAQR